MRIVGGSHRGLKLQAPPGSDIRPTTDRIREALFNILAHGRYGEAGQGLPRDARVVDAFAGTGALGLEALSRGAEHVTFLDTSPAALDLIQANTAACREQNNATILRGDATNPPPCTGAPCDLAFLDAPYNRGLAAPALAALATGGWLRPGAVAVVELAAKEVFDVPPGYSVTDDRNYGATRLLILEWNQPLPD
jgi:16S rRNA (guanine966-N2)-methyltransferase